MQLCGYEVGNRRPFFLIAGPCVIESEAMALDIAHQMKEITGELGIPYIFKASYDKANRTSGKSFRGLGMEKGLEILAKVRAEVGVPVLTDVHTEAEVPAVAAVVDVLQPDGLHPGLCAVGQTRQYQEGAVPRSRRHGERDCQGPRGCSGSRT